MDFFLSSPKCNLTPDIRWYVNEEQQFIKKKSHFFLCPKNNPIYFQICLSYQKNKQYTVALSIDLALIIHKQTRKFRACWGWQSARRHWLVQPLSSLIWARHGVAPRNITRSPCALKIMQYKYFLQKLTNGYLTHSYAAHNYNSWSSKLNNISSAWAKTGLERSQTERLVEQTPTTPSSTSLCRCHYHLRTDVFTAIIIMEKKSLLRVCFCFFIRFKMVKQNKIHFILALP